MSKLSREPDPDEVAQAQPYQEPQEDSGQDSGDVNEGEVGPDES